MVVFVKKGSRAQLVFDNIVSAGDPAPLAAPAPIPAQVEAEMSGAFTLTLKDMFTNTHTVQVTPETKVFEVKELLRANVPYVDAIKALLEAHPDVRPKRPRRRDARGAGNWCAGPNTSRLGDFQVTAGAGAT